jgi:hypothetical protein
MDTDMPDHVTRDDVPQVARAHVQEAEHLLGVLAVALERHINRQYEIGGYIRTTSQQATLSLADLEVITQELQWVELYLHKMQQGLD